MNYNSYTVEELKQQIRNRFINVRSITGKRRAELVLILEQQDERDRRAMERREAADRLEAAHRQDRQLGLRYQANVNTHIDTLEYPFSFLRGGDYVNECDSIPGQPNEDIGTFPDNIAEYIWIRPGENDGQPWLVLCRLDTGVYVYYRGECDYTGFDCQGQMQMYASKDPNILLQYGMTSADYDAYFAETEARD